MPALVSRWPLLAFDVARRAHESRGEGGLCASVSGRPGSRWRWPADAHTCDMCLHTWGLMNRYRIAADVRYERCALALNSNVIDFVCMSEKRRRTDGEKVCVRVCNASDVRWD